MMLVTKCQEHIALNGMAFPWEGNVGYEVHPTRTPWPDADPQAPVAAAAAENLAANMPEDGDIPAALIAAVVGVGGMAAVAVGMGAAHALLGDHDQDAAAALQRARDKQGESQPIWNGKERLLHLTHHCIPETCNSEIAEVVDADKRAYK